MNRGRLSKFISVVVTGVIAISGLPSMVLADVINAPTYYSVQSDLSYEITTNITSSWINHESIDLVLTNTGTETIHNWYLTFNTPYNIDNIWNGALYEADGNGTYTITSNGWNQDIHSGESVTVGITFSSDTETELSVDPEWYLLNTQATVVDASQYALEYTEYSAWETGFTGQLTLAPQVDCQHWELSFDSNREITAVSSAVLISDCENNYAITHDENNMRLFAGTAYNFGIQGVNTEDPLEFSNVELTVVDLAYHLTDDEDANGIPDYLEFIGGGSIVDPTPTPTPVPTEVPTETPTTEPTGTETPTPTEEPTPTPIIDYESDQDLDGLPDYIEDQLGTDPLKADTDDDGLSDYIEVAIGYDPTSPDSDGNGLIDGDEDLDNDGLKNIEENQLGTDLSMYDSDSDWLSDGDEVILFGTNPLEADSDYDGLLDDEELKIGKNPINASDAELTVTQTLTTRINNANDPAITSVEITMDLPCDIKYVAYVEDLYNIDLYSTDVYGRIGSPIELGSYESYDSALVVFDYDETALGDTIEENLGVLWYDELNETYVVQEQAVVDITNNTISVQLSHFSTYVIVDLSKWNNPVVPNYSDYLFIGEGGTGYYAWHDGIPTLDEEEYECFVWWKLSHGGQYQIVQRLNGEAHTDNPTGILQLWEYSYTWLIMDKTDVDEDSVPDWLETMGVLGFNRHIYYSDSALPDTDGDGLLDGEEFGIIVYPDSTDNLCVYAKMKSYPDKDNSDNDSMIDSLDSYPLVTQTDRIFILFEGADATNISSARTFYDKYIGCNLNCELLDFVGIDDFLCSWVRIGRKSIMGIPFTTDDYYHVTDTIIVAHGAYDGFALGADEWFVATSTDYYGNSGFIGVNDLPCKTMDNLHLRICDTAQNEITPNIPEEFITGSFAIDYVYAFDCELTVATFNDCGDERYSLLGATVTSAIVIDGVGYPIELFIDRNTHQQCVYYRGDSAFIFSNIYQGTNNGINFVCDNCYGNDYIMKYQNGDGWRYLQPARFCSYFDPILERYGYDS